MPWVPAEHSLLSATVSTPVYSGHPAKPSGGAAGDSEPTEMDGLGDSRLYAGSRSPRAGFRRHTMGRKHPDSVCVLCRELDLSSKAHTYPVLPPVEACVVCGLTAPRQGRLFGPRFLRATRNWSSDLSAAGGRDQSWMASLAASAASSGPPPPASVCPIALSPCRDLGLTTAGADATQ